MSYDAFGVGAVLPRYAFAGRAAVCEFRCLCGGKLSRCYAFAGHVVVCTYGVIADGGDILKIFYCKDNFEDMMCCIYDAWASKAGHENVRLMIDGEFEYELFTEYIMSETVHEKFYKVIRAIQQKISMEAYTVVYRAAMSFEKERLDIIYRFLVDGFKYGGRALYDYRLESVRQINRIAKKAGNESHLFLGFIRFEEMKNRVLFAQIEPKCNVLTLVAPHFEERMPDENWIIYDKRRRLAAIHPAGRQYYISALTDAEVEQIRDMYENDTYEFLWRVFFNTIGIDERKNPAC